MSEEIMNYIQVPALNQEVYDTEKTESNVLVKKKNPGNA